MAGPRVTVANLQQCCKYAVVVAARARLARTVVLVFGPLEVLPRLQQRLPVLGIIVLVTGA